MYDSLTTSYTFSCPRARRDARPAVALPPARGAARARIIRRCTASSSRAAAATSIPGLVTHDELDWAPLGLQRRDDVRQPDDVARASRSATSWPISRRRGSRRGSGRGASSAGRRSVRGRCSRRRSGCSRRRPPAIASGSRCAARSAARCRSTSSRASTSTCRSSTTARSEWCGHLVRATTPRRRSRSSATSSWSAAFDARRLELSERTTHERVPSREGSYRADGPPIRATRPC